jgi:5-methylcytosine-specific restriction endonuclease McrA
VIRSLLLEISEKEGAYAIGAKHYLQSSSYSDDVALSYLKEVLEQSYQAKRESHKMFGSDLLKRIEFFINSIEKEVIVIKRNKKEKVTRTIYGIPTSGTLGDFWLLKDEYRRLDPTWIDKKPEQWRSLTFHDQFMNYMLRHFGELHCEYCGKPNLRIFKWFEKQDLKIMSTVDHFLPKKEYPNLVEEPKNLFICCNKCNQDKKTKIISEEEIKHRYDDSIRIKFVFDESKLNEKEAFIKPRQ